MRNLVLLFLIVGPLCAQTVSLGGIELRLGVTEDSVLTVSRKSYFRNP